MVPCQRKQNGLHSGYRPYALFFERATNETDACYFCCLARASANAIAIVPAGCG
jgi:hypothetical protein